MLTNANRAKKYSDAATGYYETDRWRVCPATQHRHPNYRLVCGDCNESTCVKMSAKGLDDRGQPLPYQARPVCGARTRPGGTCGQKVVPGKAKCRFHGGKSTGPKSPEGRARIAEAQRLRWQEYRRGKV